MTRGPDGPAKFDDPTATVRRPPRPRPLGAVLRVHGPPAAPMVFRLVQGRAVVGSGPDCEVVIDDATVSRKHLEVELVPEGLAVTDLGSTNGTFYLGQRVEKMILAIGGRLTLGATATLAVDADTEGLAAGSDQERTEYRGVVGLSFPMRRLFSTLARLEGSLVTILVEGESGVGKELIARALHEGSRVSGGPLVIVNCGGIPRELVASELFGHRRGAFTGAIDARRGAFETADGGTLFLDEIGELPLEVQPMLLRALETGEVRAVGDDQPRHVKVRVIAATNRNLEDEVAHARFREDLFYRLAVVRLYVQPLRDRVEDIEPLAGCFARAAGVEELSKEVIDELKTRPWPGNVRELRNAIQAYGALGVLPQPGRSKAALVNLVLSELVDMNLPYLKQRNDLGERFTKIYLAMLLTHAGGNQTVAARIAGMDRTHLGRLLAKYGMRSGER